MAFLSGSATFLRYRVVGPRTSMFDGDYLTALRAKAGRSAARSTPGAEVETGWMAGRHIFDGDFTELKNVYPEWLLFDLQTQVDRLPGDRLKAYQEADLAALARDNPSGFASARQKREAKASGRQQLLDEAKDGRYRKWTCVPCAWDGPSGIVFFGATSQAQADRFTNLFLRTFGPQSATEATEHAPARPATPGFVEGLEAVTAASLAVELNPAAANERLSPFLEGITPEDGPTWCPDSNTPQFLGNEFLLWLWYYADVHGATVQGGDGREITFSFQGGVKLEDPRGQTGNATFNSDSGTRLPETRAAAKAGKLPRKASISLVRDGEIFTGILHAETLAMSSVRMPPWEGEGQQRAREEQRLTHLRDLGDIVDQLFAAFLARRLSPNWAGEVASIGRWLRASRVPA